MADQLFLVDRFWAKVDRSGGPGACWPWTASRFPEGYGRFGMRSHRHGVARETIRDIRIGKSWAHLIGGPSHR